MRIYVKYVPYTIAVLLYNYYTLLFVRGLISWTRVYAYYIINGYLLQVYLNIKFYIIINAILYPYRLNLIRRRLFEIIQTSLLIKVCHYNIFYNEGREHISNTNIINGINTHILRLTSKLIYILYYSYFMFNYYLCSGKLCRILMALWSAIRYLYYVTV